MKKILPLLTLLTWFANGLLAQPGTLDSDFDADGKVTTAISASYNDGQSVVVQPDGKIVVIGNSNNITGDFAVVRYNTDGTLDNSFSSDGKVVTDINGVANYAFCGAIQPDGKIIAAGYTYVASWDFAVVRYNTDGTLDNDFGTGGIVTTDFNGYTDEAYGITIQSDGKILVAGKSTNVSDQDFALARYNGDGSLDNTFSVDGKATTSFGSTVEVALSVAIQPDGKIIAGGSSYIGTQNDFAIARYNTDGTLDLTFSVDGKVTTDIGSLSNDGLQSIIISDGKLVAAGFSTINISQYCFAIVKYNSDGTLDNNFSSDGKVTTTIGLVQDNATFAIMQPDGKIILAGSSDNGTDIDFALARYNTDGTLDLSFSADGKVTTPFGYRHDIAECVAMQPNGRIVAVGYSEKLSGSDIAIARYISGLNLGIIDFSIADNVLIYPNPIQQYGVLEYTLVQNEVLSIGLYDVSGRLIKPFVNYENRNKGTHKESLNWGESLNSGNYLLTITNGDGSTSIQVTKQ